MRKVKLIYPKLSYQIVGILFEVHNTLGYGHREITYQKAIVQALKDIKINFSEQLSVDLKYKEKIIKKYRLDFLIDNKLVLEIKVGERFNKENTAQVYDYLKAKGLKLGIIGNFTKYGVKFKRIINKNK